MRDLRSRPKDPDAQDQLAEAERDAWRQFWADVDPLLKKTQPKE
jgi:hypothetical protein